MITTKENTCSRILCIDGGGTRGVMAIEMLKHLQYHLAPRKLLDCFDLICGTSTGGIIVLGLVAGFDLEQIEELYDELPTLIFPKNVWNWGRYLWSGGNQFYDPTPLESLLKKFFRGKTLADIPASPKFFIVTTEVGQTTPAPYLLRNYQAPLRYNSKSLLGNFVLHPGNHSAKDMPLWAAARATSASPTYFPPFLFGDSLFSDGGLVANCPLEFALQEAFAMDPNLTILYIVSLGTGLVVQPTGRNIFSWGNYVIDTVTDSERTFQSVIRWLSSSCRGIELKGDKPSLLIRWNPNAVGIPLDETRSYVLSQLKKEVSEKFLTSMEIIHDMIQLRNYLGYTRMFRCWDMPSVPSGLGNSSQEK